MIATARIIDDTNDNELTITDFLKGAIIETVSDLSDEKTLRYIYDVLMKAVTVGTQQADC